MKSTGTLRDWTGGAGVSLIFAGIVGPLSGEISATKATTATTVVTPGTAQFDLEQLR